MTNEEKAKLISEQFHCDDVAYDAAEQMAEWKEQQMIEKACEWLGPVLKDLAGYNCGDDLIEDFKKAKVIAVKIYI